MKRLKVAAIAAMLAVSATYAAAQTGADAPPRYAVDPFWPKPLPDTWILGQVSGIAVDGEDNVWIVHRPSTLVDDEKGAQKSPPETRCCKAPPAVLQFSDGDRLQRQPLHLRGRPRPPHAEVQARARPDQLSGASKA